MKKLLSVLFCLAMVVMVGCGVNTTKNLRTNNNTPITTEDLGDYSVPREFHGAVVGIAAILAGPTVKDGRCIFDVNTKNIHKALVLIDRNGDRVITSEEVSNAVKALESVFADLK